MPSTAHRRKLSTTISEESYRYLADQVEMGKVATIAEAVDHAVRHVRMLDNRMRLEAATAAYFQNLPPQAAAEEQRLEAALGSVVDEVNLGS